MTNETSLIDMHIVPGQNEILISLAAYNKIVLPFADKRSWAPREAIEFSGVIVSRGMGAHEYSEGDEVFGLMPGALPFYAEATVLAKPWQVSLKPVNVSHTQAAKIPYAALTAWQALFDHGMLRAGQKVIVVSDSSLVGNYVVQLAKQAGACVKAITIDTVQQQQSDCSGFRFPEADLLINVSKQFLDSALLDLVRDGGRVIMLNNLSEQAITTSKHIHVERCITMMYPDELKQIARLLADEVLSVPDAVIFSPFKSTFTQCCDFETCDTSLRQVV